MLITVAPALHVQGADGHDLIAVYHAAGFIHQQTAVRVAVEGHADVIALLYHLGRQVLQVGRTAAVVDVHAVGGPVEEDGVGLEPSEQLRGRGAGGAVGAVHQDAQPRQIRVNGGGHEVDVIPLELLHAVMAAAQFPPGLESHGFFRKDFFLHPLLQRVGELVALAVENLDSVVLIGVVRGGNHDARVRLFLPGEVGHGGRRNISHGFYVAAHGAQPRNQRRLQQIRGDAGVLAQDHRGALPPLFLHQNRAHGLPHPEGQVRRQVLPHDAPDAVGAK